MNVKIGRNEPCYCGSGKKFKKCCFITQEENRIANSHVLSPEKRELKLDDTIGTGLSTILAKNLGLVDDADLPKKVNKYELDSISLKEIQNLFNGEKITVHPLSDGKIEIKTKNGVIILEN